MASCIARRKFLAALGGAAAAWPPAAHAQQAAMPVVGVVRMASRGQSTHLEHAFRQGLTQAGYFENQNVAIEWRWLEGRYERLPGTLGELINHRVAAIVVPGSAGAALTAKAATQTIPIVFMTGGDPVELGLVASLAHPGGNITGVAMLQWPPSGSIYCTTWYLTRRRLRYSQTQQMHLARRNAGKLKLRRGLWGFSCLLRTRKFKMKSMLHSRI